MRFEGDAARWFQRGKRDAAQGKMPRSVVMGEIPAAYGKAYNLGYRDARKRQPKGKGRDRGLTSERQASIGVLPPDRAATVSSMSFLRTLVHPVWGDKLGAR